MTEPEQRQRETIDDVMSTTIMLDKDGKPVHIGSNVQPSDVPVVATGPEFDKDAQ